MKVHPSGALRYSDLAIETMLTLRAVFHQTNRQIEGLVGSLFALLAVALPVPDHITLSRRGRRLEVALLTEAGVDDAPVIEPLLEQVELPLASVAADGAYDRAKVYRAVQTRSPSARIAIPPRRDAQIQQHGNTPAAP